MSWAFILVPISKIRCWTEGHGFDWNPLFFWREKFALLNSSFRMLFNLEVGYKFEFIDIMCGRILEHIVCKLSCELIMKKMFRAYIITVISETFIRSSRKFWNFRNVRKHFVLKTRNISTVNNSCPWASQLLKISVPSGWSQESTSCFTQVTPPRIQFLTIRVIGRCKNIIAHYAKI